jgi:hypothetical protein
MQRKNTNISEYLSNPKHAKFYNTKSRIQNITPQYVYIFHFSNWRFYKSYE